MDQYVNILNGYSNPSTLPVVGKNRRMGWGGDKSSLDDVKAEFVEIRCRKLKFPFVLVVNLQLSKIIVRRQTL